MNMKAAQRAYDDMEPEWFEDPMEHPMLDEYIEEHGITLDEFGSSVSERVFFNWVKERSEEFHCG